MSRQTQALAGTIGVTLRLPHKTHEAARVEAARQRKSLNLYVAEILTQATQKQRPRKQPA